MSIKSERSCRDETAALCKDERAALRRLRELLKDQPRAKTSADASRASDSAAAQDQPA